jgi:hypothetical protein
MSIGRVPWRLANSQTPGGRGLPVRAQRLQQPRGEGDVAVLGALALLDPHRHAIGIDVRHFEGDRLAHAQTRGVDGRQQEPMARMPRHGEQPPHFFPAQDLGQFLRLLRERDVKVCARVAERHVVEEAEGIGRLTARAPGELALLNQMGEVRLDFVAGDLVRGSAVVPRQADHRGDVRLVGARGETAHGQVADHAGAELAHGTPPWSDELQGGDGASTERRSTVACVERAAADQQNDGRVIRIDVRATASAV